MARLRSMQHVSADRISLHQETDCGWRSFQADGERILQLDTYGSDGRAISGKVSQSVQLDQAHAQQLVDIIRQTFPGVK
ncbi:hypothetical protein HMPREF0063_10985 [Aeromicrobium marinum DSM 15272]|uniref:Uncharacterized protein n=1 Tax=Aeromicrobium marinum DSM 15272 TaxID=585531 RepID=E2SAJ5_9ACTN|nr:hypothetical protein [Aeromicrobium marinum]EFQ84269.1 hypothetical protein HMPREF0063_10985 [Aeromicrobium marinum DSM 15272]